MGTPLHWAVRTGNLQLIQTLLDLGADLNKRWLPPQTFHGDVPAFEFHSLSPLDIAVGFHLHAAVELLLDYGCLAYGGYYEEEHSAFHCVGLTCLPFSRYIIHNAQYRESLRKVISSLTKRNLPINQRNRYRDTTLKDGNTSLMVALKNPDQPLYILEELISAGAEAGIQDSDGSNVAICVAEASALRPHNFQSMALILNDVADINAIDKYGRNALHICAISNNRGMAALLLKRRDIDVNFVAATGQNALHFAATFGSDKVLSLLVEADARLEDTTKKGATALQLAVENRRLSTIGILLRAGAKTEFQRQPDGRPRSTILHSACMGSGVPDTILAQLLDKFPEFRKPDVLNAMSDSFGTPLHRAVYFGDRKSVEVLLEHGADLEIRDSSRSERFLQGKTPLDMAIETISNGEKGILYPGIKRAGTAAINSFVANLKEIRLMLEEKRNA